MNPLQASPGASASNYGVVNNPYATNHHVGTVQGAELGYGIGTAINRICGGCMDRISTWWNRPTPEQISKQRAMQIQIKVFHRSVEELVPQLDSALSNIRKNPEDSDALKRIQKIASKHAKILEPYEREDLRSFQLKEFKKLDQRIATLPT